MKIIKGNETQMIKFKLEIDEQFVEIPFESKIWKQDSFSNLFVYVDTLLKNVYTFTQDESEFWYFTCFDYVDGEFKTVYEGMLLGFIEVSPEVL